MCVKMGKIKDFFNNSKILFKVVRKPTLSEFNKVSLIAGAGILLIGLIGYVVILLFSFFKVV